MMVRLIMVDITRAEPVVDHDMAADGGEVGDAFESGVGDAFESGTGVGLGTSVVSPGSAALATQQKAAISEPYAEQASALTMD